MITSGSETSKIMPNPTNKKPLTTFKSISEKLTVKLLCDVIFSSLPSQSSIPRFTIAIFQLNDYPLQPKLSNHTKFKYKNL